MKTISWSLISIASRFGAVAIGIFQSLVIVKLLTLEEYGLLGIVTGIGATIGVYQNLGISSGSTREISAATNKSEAFKVFVGSLFVRYLISVPLVISLIFFADKISSSVNDRPEIIFPLRLFALTLLIQSLQSVLNSVIQGFKEFKFLFLFQILIAFVSLAIYIPLINVYGFLGYFYALLIFNAISTLVLAFYVLKIFKGHIEYPTFYELKRIIKSVFAIGLFVFLIKILDTQWQKLGPVILGLDFDDAAVGLFTFALLISSKIVTISDAVTDVTLPSMTSIYEKSKENFHKIFIRSNTSFHLLISAACVIFILFKAELFWALDYIFMFMGNDLITHKYSGAFILMDPLVLAFWGYSHLNLLRSGYSVPSKRLMGAVASHLFLFFATWFFYKYPLIYVNPLMNLSLAMAFAGFFSYLVYLLYIYIESRFILISWLDFISFVISVLAVGLFYLGISFVLIFPFYFCFIYYAYKYNKALA